MALRNNNWEKGYLDINSVEFKKVFKELGIDIDLCIMQASNILEEVNLNHYLNSIFQTLIKGINDEVLTRINKEKWKGELINIYDAIDKEHSTLKLISNRKDEDIIIENTSIINLIKKTLLVEILDKSNVQFDIVDFKTKEVKEPIVSSKVFKEIMYELNNFLKDTDEFNKEEFSENKMYLIIFELLKTVKLLPFKQLENEHKIDIDKSRYIRSTLNNYYEKHPNLKDAGESVDDNNKAYYEAYPDEKIDLLNDVRTKLEQLSTKFI